MNKNVFVLLLGNSESEPADLYQGLQKQNALAQEAESGLRVEVVCAPGFDQYRLLRRRLADTSSPVDAVLTEPANASTLAFVVKALKGHTSLVLLNAWDPLVEEHLADWGQGLAIASVSAPQLAVGEMQGRQTSAVVPTDGSVLVVTGPSRSSAARERLEGLRSTIRSDIKIHEAEAGQWTEADGILAFNAWYNIFRSRHEEIHAIAGQSDDVAAGARGASLAVADSGHARMFASAKALGVGTCPGFGKELVDDGTLHSSIVLPPNTGMALKLLERFWTDGQPPPPRSFTKVTPYPPTSVDPS